MVEGVLEIRERCGLSDLELGTLAGVAYRTAREMRLTRQPPKTKGAQRRLQAFLIKNAAARTAGELRFAGAP
ncbi:MAG TPA: hypothetical protein VGI10_04390 [Polyangiaceae bacterium]